MTERFEYRLPQAGPAALPDIRSVPRYDSICYRFGLRYKISVIL